MAGFQLTPERFGNRLNLVPGLPETVRAYSVTGDGQTDDYNALREVAAKFGTTGHIYFPAGTYRVGTNLTFNCLCEFAPGATFDPDSGVTVTLAGPVRTAPGSSIIASGTTGTVSITGPMDAGSGVLNVKAFGAVGDGVTDDTAAIQRAINAGATLFFPRTSASYAVTTLTVADGAVWTSDGATIRKIASTSGDMVTFSGTSKSISVSGLTFDGNQSNQAAQSTDFTVTVTSTGTAAAPSRVSFERCQFINQAIGSLEIDAGASAATNKVFVRVVGCTFLGGADGVAVSYAPRFLEIKDTPYVLVDGNTFDIGDASYTVGIAGIVMSGTGTPSDEGRMTVVNNTFLGTGRDANDGLGSIDGYSYARNTIIANNRLESPKTRGINVKADGADTVISGNIVRGLTGSVVDGSIAFTSSTTDFAAGRIVVTGNVISESKGLGISVSGASEDTPIAANVMLSNNVIARIGVGASLIHYGINVSAVNSFLIANNQITDINPDAIAAGGIAIRIISCTGSGLIVGNNIRNVAGQGIATATSTALVLSIIGNTLDTTTNVSGITSRGFNIDAVEAVQIKDNTLVDIEAGEAAIRVSNTTEDSSVMGNVVTGTSTVGFSNGGTNTALVCEANFFPASTFQTLTIASGAITVFSDYHVVDTEGAGATDDLDTINGGRPYQRITFTAANSSRDVVFKDGTGNLRLAGDFTLTDAQDTITLVYNGTTWLEVCRSDNLA